MHQKLICNLLEQQKMNSGGFKEVGTDRSPPRSAGELFFFFICFCFFFLGGGGGVKFLE